MVPRSFSRTTASAVAITELTMRMKASRPGTRKIDDSRFGLYQTSGRAVIRGSSSRPASGGPAAATICRA